MILFVGYSRVYLGTHWYLDVVGGYVLGGAILMVAVLVYEHFEKGSDPEQSRPAGGRVGLFESRNECDGTRIFDQRGNVRSAGAIVYRNVGKTREYLLVFRSYQNDYSFPKGRVEKGERAKSAAMREVLEETGYKIKVTKDLDPITYSYPEGGGVIVEMFEATVAGRGKKIETNESEMWVAEEKVIGILTYSNLKTYFKRYLEEKHKC
jgi:8-oxo-dGTP pyrophosphatase MutT (NUDIX family)